MIDGASNTLRRWLREPLLHFVALGTALLALYGQVAPRVSTKAITVSQPVLRSLRQAYLQKNGDLPNRIQEDALINRFVDGEVLYREALALGLDREDRIVRRRLEQKMRFLIEDLEPIPEPNDRELRAYLDRHLKRYSRGDRVAFVHVFAATERHRGDVERAASELRAQLVAGADPSRIGDPFLHGREFPLRTRRKIAAMFGKAFAARVMDLPVGGWSTPLRSSYGLHLVRVTERSPASPPALAEVRAAVRRDWREQRRLQANRAALDRLRRGYELRVERSEQSLTQLAASQ